MMMLLVVVAMANTATTMNSPDAIACLEQLTSESMNSVVSQASSYHATPGVDDIRSKEFTLIPQLLPEDFEYEYTYEDFATDGHDICVYGEFDLYRSDLWVEFFFIDDVGFADYIALEVTDRKHEHIVNQYVSHEWNEILPSFYMGEYVSTWYVILSVVYAPPTEEAREGNLYVGRDLMAPTVEINFPSVVTGTASAIISLEELNCKLEYMKVWIDNLDNHPCHEESISGNLCTRTVIIDSTEYEDGNHSLWVYASDTGYASRLVEHKFTISNTPSTPTDLPSTPTNPPINWTEIVQNIYQNFENPISILAVLLNLVATSISIVKVKRKSQSDVTCWDWAFIFGWIFFVVYLVFGGMWQILSIVVPSFLLLLSFVEEVVEQRVT
jgi:hypothetical protein